MGQKVQGFRAQVEQLRIGAARSIVREQQAITCLSHDLTKPGRSPGHSKADLIRLIEALSGWVNKQDIAEVVAQERETRQCPPAAALSGLRMTGRSPGFV